MDFMSKRLKTLAKLAIICASFVPSLAPQISIAAPTQYLQSPLFLQMLDELETEHQFNRQDLVTLFSDVYQRDDILEAMSKPAEKTKTWSDYKPIFVNDLGTKRGVEFWQKHEAILSKAAAEFKIPEAIIVAIIGVETRYGNYKGKHKVIEALSTLAFAYPPRSAFFYGQLKQFLILSRQLAWDPHAILGSYAGAMGYAQFIPSSYLKLAIDYNGDGVPDLINSPDDAIGSIANYFRHHEWQPEAPVLLPAKKVKPESEVMLNMMNKPLDPTITLEQAAKAGLVLETSRRGDFLVRPFTFINEGEEELWFGLKNFFVITEYNHSKLYARAVFELATAVESKYQKATNKSPHLPLAIQ